MMSSKGISQENNQNQVESSTEEQNDTTSETKSLSQILLDIEEKPELTVEKILINIFNKFITPGNVEMDEKDVQQQKSKIKFLCFQIEKSKIVYILLTKIRSLIKKYREKLFELPNIIELREKIFKKYYKRSHSFGKIISKHYLKFALDRPSINHSFSRAKKLIFNYYLTVKNLFFELKNIKNCLRRTAPIIEKIFEEALSKFPKFSIWECEKEDYLKILIHDNFIWEQISQSKESYLNEIIEEITENDDMNLTEMTEKIEYFKLIEEHKKISIDDMLKLSEIGSSLDTRFPEDAKPLIPQRDDFFQSIIAEDKDIHFSYEETDIDDFTSPEGGGEDELNNPKRVTLFNRFKKKITIQKKNIITRKQINKINIREDNKYIDIPNLLKNDLTNKDTLEKMITLNKNNELKKIYEKSINNNTPKQKKKMTKNKNKKKESDEMKNSNKKIDIPNDIDDLVKYIVNDDKNEGGGKKKKKNKKKKKKKNNEMKEDKKEENAEGDKDIINNKDEIEIEEVKEDLSKNSINRFKIHKIKFKYRPKWIKKIENNKKS